MDRIFRAVDEGETVCIYGDYDVDGVTSVALLRAILMAYEDVYKRQDSRLPSCCPDNFRIGHGNNFPDIVPRPPGGPSMRRP